MKRKNSEKKKQEFYKKNLKNSPFLLEDKEEYLTESAVTEYVLSPMLLLFSIWILQEAKKDHVKKLYFLARDAYLVYEVSKRICKNCNLEIECRYFYCSRYSLRVPMYAYNISEALAYICRSGIDVTFEKLMIRSGFQKNEIEEMKQIFSDIDFEERIPYCRLKEIKERLSKECSYLEKLKATSNRKWDSTKKYFFQEGMITEETIGIVDSGWTGSIEKSIADIRHRCGCLNKIKGYYFGLFEKVEMDPLLSYAAFYFEPEKGLLNKVMFSNCLLEAVFRENKGTTCGYYQKEKIFPEFEEYQPDLKLDNVLKCFRQYTDRFFAKHSKIDIDSISVNKEKQRLQKSLRSFMWKPSKEEAEFFGSFSFSDDLLDQTKKELAPKMPNEHLKENRFSNRLLTALAFRKKHIHESGWFEASVIRSKHYGRRYIISNSAYKGWNYIRKGLKKG